MKFDIVIACKNSYSKKNYSIFFTIKTLLAQKHVNFNLYVVDDNSEDDTFNLLKSDFKKYPNIVFLKSDSTGVAAARNFGARHGSSSIIFFMDDDTLLYDEHTLACSITNFSSYSFSCGASRLWTPLQWNKFLFKTDTTKRLMTILRHISFPAKGIDRDTGANDLNHVTFIGNYGMIQRSVFDSFDGFPLIYKGWGMEDTHLMYTLCLNGHDYGIFSEKDIKVFHLNHTVDKNESFPKNYQQFKNFQKEVGVDFNEAAFFDLDPSYNPVLRNNCFKP